MDLLIVRHAIAFERDPGRWPDDRDRPLRPQGRRRAQRAAKGLERIAQRPHCLLTSPLARARQTAALLSECAGWPEPLQCAALAPGTAPESVLRALQCRPERLIAIVGHQPDLGELLAHSLPGTLQPRAIELKKFGAALVSFDGAVVRGGARLRWLLTPRLLRAAR